MPTDADLIAFGLMCSGMIGAAAVTVWGVLCFTGGGPFGATLTMTGWGWRLLRKDPFPLGSVIFWVSTTDAFVGLEVMRGLVATAWIGMFLMGLLLTGVDAVAGPKETRFFTDPVTGQPMMVRSRMREKRVLPPKLEKARKATMPARDRLAHSLDAKRWAKNEGRRQVGLPPLPESRARRALNQWLPTGKTKDPKPPRKERAAARRDARAEVVDGRLPPPPPTPPKLPDSRVKAGVDPAAPARPPVNLTKQVRA